MEFEALNDVKDTDTICPIHRKALVTFGSASPFCIDCRKQELKAKEQQLAKAGKQRYDRRRTIETLEKDSIVGDRSLWQSSFDNYQPDSLESSTALTDARLFAEEYLKTLNRLGQLKKGLASAQEKNGFQSAEALEIQNQLLKLDRQTAFNVIFSGVPGVGKSHLGMSILKYVNENANPLVSCLFISVNDLMRMIKDSITNKQSRYTEENMIRALSKADLLVLDDLGSESSFRKKETSESSEYNQRVLFSILNSRTRTIITTNLSSRELEEIYNPKIVSRIYRGVEGHIIKFTKATKDKRSKINF